METQLKESVLYLQNFAPLIQLWAGICLLFFYESFLEKSPFSALCDEIRNLYNNFKNQYNGLIPIDAISANEYVKDHWSNNFVPTIKCVASLCFFYSAFILAFIGIECNPNYGADYYCALQVMNTIVWIYLVAAIFFYKSKIFHGFTTSIILSISLLVYFHFHFILNDFCASYVCIGDVWNKNCVTIYTVFTCIGGVLLVCFRLLLSWVVLQCQKYSVKRMDKEMRVFANYNLGRIKINDLPKKKVKKIINRCTTAISNGEEQNFGNETFNKYMNKEVEEEYYDFTSKWWTKLY